MDRINAMMVFNAVVEAGSFSAAGRKLGKPQTTISRQVKELEDHLGTQLIIRSTRSLSLTESGQDYLESSRQVLALVGEMERAASGEYVQPKGNLTITAPVVFGQRHVLPLVTEFLKHYPEVNLRLMLADQHMHLYEDFVDIAVRIGKLPDSNLIAKRVGEVSKVVCASPGYIQSHGTPHKPEDLIMHQCICFEGLDSPNEWIFSRNDKAFGVRVNPRIRLNSIDAAITMAKEGLGITRLLSYQVSSSFNDGSLQPLLTSYCPTSWPVSVVFIRQGAIPMKVRRFVDFIVPRLKQVLADM
ncbi:LysR family transcriptional regulator [Bowmanella sp. Y26]|uniref:LysR substrate-binding domain-containing protein n=1 Tax=Bowmanella yangjiangensis TaxID=2811230 RepID=UPI001BDC6E2B|nr:LysR family transcriptional regulator [Bowmanella yangjiangensis]MBT1063336.1 LysR family transcriptional regulator [Bowmanella yangjiangensis]